MRHLAAEASKAIKEAVVARNVNRRDIHTGSPADTSNAIQSPDPTAEELALAQCSRSYRGSLVLLTLVSDLVKIDEPDHRYRPWRRLVGNLESPMDRSTE